jgi:hypothetical protein
MRDIVGSSPVLAAQAESCTYMVRRMMDLLDKYRDFEEPRSNGIRRRIRRLLMTVSWDLKAMEGLRAQIALSLSLLEGHATK